MRYLAQTFIVLIALNPAAANPAMVATNPEGKTQTFTISGNVGMEGVTIMGLPGEPVTDTRGYYNATVDYGWSGTVTPAKEGFLFEPASRKYVKVISDQANNNYSAMIITYTISGHVHAYVMPRHDLSGVLMQGLPGNPVTDENGYYTSTVDYGWTGTVKPIKEGYTFNPPRLSYNKVTKDQKKQNYTVKQLPQVHGQSGGRSFEPVMATLDGRGSRRTGRSTGYRSALVPTTDRKVLVVPAAEVKAQDLAEIIEDMQVMSHILDERFKETRRIQGVFTDFGDFFGRDNRQTEATYLQGFGMLFSMEVNFAFSPSLKQQQQQDEQTGEPVDSTWENARLQMFSPGNYKAAGRSDAGEEYNSRMVEELKQDLITTLKHAANIRGMQPDEWIILTVIGGGRQGGFGGGGFMMGGMGGAYGGTSSGGMMGGIGAGMGSSGGGGMGGGMMGGMSGGMMGGGMMGGGMMGGGMGGMTGLDDMGISAATVLTIRAKKSDVDAFANSELDFDQFRQMVQIFTY